MPAMPYEKEVFVLRNGFEFLVGNNPRPWKSTEGTCYIRRVMRGEKQERGGVNNASAWHIIYLHQARLWHFGNHDATLKTDTIYTPQAAVLLASEEQLALLRREQRRQEIANTQTMKMF